METENVNSVFYIQALDCADEMRVIERRLRNMRGIADLRANFLQHTLIVEHDGTVTDDQIKKAVQDAGFKAVLEEEHQDKPGWWPQNVRGVLTIVAGVFLAGGAAASLADAPETLTMILLLIAMVTGGYYIVQNGVRGALKLNLDMNFLMTIAAVGAVAVGEFFEGASVMFLFSVAQWLESRSIGRARDAIAKLLDLSPREAVVVRDGTEVQVPVEDVAVGEIVIIKPGERIPLDGEVAEGLSDVDESPVTGESMPVEKSIGATVFAGSINRHGSISVRSTKAYGDTTLSKIIHMVEQAQSRRAPSQHFVDHFARIYTPVVILGAILVAAIPPMFGLPAADWAYRALVLLVIACPCALVISTPVTIVCALARSARQGVLIKGGVHLENVGRIDTVILDKTGTLTEGKPQVVEILPMDATAPQEILRIAAAIESRSEHHLGRAVLQRAREDGIEPPPANNFSALPGRGARADINGTTYYAGNVRMFRELGAELSGVEERMAHHASSGGAMILVGTAEEIIGGIAVSDVVRKEALPAMNRLRRMGINDLIMITGDNEAAARTVAEKLNLSAWYAGLLPEDKVAKVEQIIAEGKAAAMIGDGVNDAPALAASTVGIAMGTAGTDAAIETADIALMADDLEKVPYAASLGRKTLAVIRQNIALSLLIKALFIVLTFAGVASLWLAIVADMGASMLVIFNGMRLLNFTDKSETPIDEHTRETQSMYTPPRTG